jgi:Tetratricopeptide repeat
VGKTHLAAAYARAKLAEGWPAALARMGDLVLERTQGQSHSGYRIRPGPCLPTASGSWATPIPDTLTSRNDLASAYRMAGGADEAIRLSERTVADREQALGADHPATLTARNGLSVTSYCVA